MRVRTALLLASIAVSAVWLYSRRAASWERLHPELRSPWLRFRTPSTIPMVVKAMRFVGERIPMSTKVAFESHSVPGPEDAPEVTVYVYRPEVASMPSAALLYIHGGGYMIGSARMFHETCARYARELGIVVVNVDYRLAPETPFPGPLEDCYAALRWMKEQEDMLGIDPDRIAVAGESAGGGLAAALVQLAHDRGEISLAFQLLMYPMLEDRTVLERDYQGRGEMLWAPGSNRLGWTSYLGREPVKETAPEYAAPARREDPSGLAPAWIGVGTLDLFYPENVEYARRLNAAGVPCELNVVEGAYHGFDGMHPDAQVSRAFTSRKLDALRRGLRLGERCPA